MGNTSIEWTDRTWNPVRGCSRISPGCVNCYAEKIASRFSDEGQAFHLFAERHPKPHWTGLLELMPDKLREPLSWRTPSRVFVNSMSDLFHESLTDDTIDWIFAVMALCPQHTFQILTKRAERMYQWADRLQRMADEWAPKTKNGRFTASDVLNLRWMHDTFGRGPAFPHTPWPLQNVWLGVSAENQEMLDKRAGWLVKTPAAVRFVSGEPLLEEISFRWAKWAPLQQHPHKNNHLDGLRGLDWVIVGGESGPGARTLDIAWVRTVVKQCRLAGVACFVKQLGGHAIDSTEPWRVIRGQQLEPLSDRKGSDMSEWPTDLRVRQFPEVRA